MAFDFGLSQDGDITMDPETHDITKKEDYKLRLQLAYDRIKSISKDWFIDECGADLEELIGKPCTPEFAELGKRKIRNMLVLDDTWSDEEFYIYCQIKDAVTIEYTIFFKIQTENNETESYELHVDLDLVKGIKLRFGWSPRRS